MEVKSFGTLISDRARVKPNKEFLIYYDSKGGRKSYSYADFIGKIGDIVSFFHRHNIQRGMRIATIMQNKEEQALLYFAAWAMGVCVAPINPAEDDERVQFIIEQSGATAVFPQDDSAERVRSILQRSQSLASVYCSDDVANHQKRDDWTKILKGKADDEGLIVYTSGTTGNPKGVLLQQKHLLNDAEAIMDWHRIKEDVKMMCVLPIHHVNGIVVTLVTPFLSQGTVVLNERFGVSYFWDRIAREGVHIVSVVPTLLEFLLQANEDVSKYSLTALRHFICGAGPLLVETVIAFEDAFNVPVIHGYGLSETTCYSSFLPIDLSKKERREWLSLYGFPSVGGPIKYNELAILDVHGKAVSEGERGEIAIRGQTVMKGYEARPDANQEAFKHGGGWFMSGDEGFYKMDSKGRPYFFITGRIKELIIRGGVNISPLEIDDALKKHPKVKYALTIPFENRYYGEEIAAYVVPKSSETVTDTEIKQHCAKRLPFMKQPKIIIFGDDLPYTSTGKPKRIQLKEQLKDRLEIYRDVQFREKK